MNREFMFFWFLCWKGFLPSQMWKGTKQDSCIIFIDRAKFISGKCVNLALGLVPCTLNEPRAIDVFKWKYYVDFGHFMLILMHFGLCGLKENAMTWTAKPESQLKHLHSWDQESLLCIETVKCFPMYCCLKVQHEGRLVMKLHLERTERHFNCHHWSPIFTSSLCWNCHP